jgi:hypothetical protein
LFELVADFGILHLRLVFRTAECKRCRVVEVSTQISKEVMNIQAMRGRLGSR